MRQASRLVGLLAAAFGVAVVGADAAAAAMCARWDAPSTATVGSPASIGFRTYVPVGLDDGYTLQPFAATDYPFRVRAVSPDGKAMRLALVPSEGDATRWAGRFTPDEAGAWTLQLPQFGSGDSRCYSDAVILVREEGVDGGTSIVWVVTLGLVVIAASGTLLLMRRRRRVQAA